MRALPTSDLDIVFAAGFAGFMAYTWAVHESSSWLDVRVRALTHGSKLALLMCFLE